MLSLSQKDVFLSTQKNNKPIHPNYLPLVAAIALALSNTVQAATFTVTNTNDAGAGSLRQAVIDANALAGADNIVFSTDLTGQTITLATGQIEISDELIITGSVTGDASSITIDGDEKSRMLYGTNNVAITLENLTLTNGKEHSSYADHYSYDLSRRAYGGAIRSDGALILNNTIVTNNYAKSDYSGALSAVRSGNITLSNSTVSNNQSDGVRGGAIHLNNSIITENIAGISGADITVNQSTISHNSGTGISGNNITVSESTINDNGAGIGFYSNAEVIVHKSTISNNSGTGIAGHNITLNESTVSYNRDGIRAAEGIVSLNQSTVSKNQNYGIWGKDEDFTLKQSTITNNKVGIVFYAYYFNSSSSNTTMSNTIISGNTEDDIIRRPYNASDDEKIKINANNCLLGDADESKIDGTNTDNIFNSNPDLGLLANNGGATFTHLPNPGSPAVNAGKNSDASDFINDQRGEGYPRIFGAQANTRPAKSLQKKDLQALPAGGIVDIGAVELQREVDTTPPVVTAPADISVNATGELTAVDIGVGTAIDDIDGVLTPTPDTTGPFPPGETIVTWTAIDSSGNKGTATQKITVGAQAIPTLSEWGVILLSMMLALTSLLGIRRKKQS